MLKILSICVSILMIAILAPPSLGEELRAGVAVTDITPPVPWRMSGYFYERVSTGVKDPLHAKAIAFQQGDVSAALVFCDVIGIPRDVSKKARELASQATGIPAENIAVAATHSHTGPLYYGPLRDFFHRRAVERLGNDPSESIDYPAKLVEQIVAAVVQAKAALQPVTLSAGSVREDRLAFNRRFHMKNGTVQFNPGRLNPDVIRVAGPIDPEVGVVSLQRPGADAPFAAVVSYALHLDTVSGTEYSADYPRHLEDGLRALFGKEFVALFGTGTCGDINHIDVNSEDVRTAQDIGAALAETAGKSLKPDGLTPIAKPDLAVRRATIDAPLQVYSAEEVAKAKKDLETIGQRQLSFLEEVKAYAIVSVDGYQAPTTPLEVQAFRLSQDVAVVTLPAEVFVELGLAIKAASPFKTTLVVELTNDSLGYIPTKKAFAEGSYETVNSRIQPGAGEAMVETAIRLLNELK
ncbi:MAG: neutral/alkaline non-lysosomal ceramidase N-terminal domain-containing protein [Pirellulales bacterium]|nr:neutral/alkaline non-lysosomal ceramidase N-terminal domain-containing protein [Pirellulales bacterium]